jgi:uncharacterized protein
MDGAIPRASAVEAPRFLCDAMLGQLGRWLRAAGYDTLVAGSDTADRALVTRALVDGRLLLTRDRKLREIRGASACAIVLRRQTLSELVAEITARLELDWMAEPFSRCLVCNLSLTPAPALARQRLPENVPASGTGINYCRQCDRLYWPGGHVRRMTDRLQRWRAGAYV